MNRASRKKYLAQHFYALFFAFLLIFIFRINYLNLEGVVYKFDERLFKQYTPYFPGLKNIEDHELFSIKYRDKKKIVILGSSGADSIGCDASWSRQDDNLSPYSNVHHSCSITGQLNLLLAEKGFSDWHVFNLARNGTALTPMLYVYSKVIEAKPEIVIWGEDYAYYKVRNADSSELLPSMYEHMDAVFGRADTESIWLRYRNTISKNATDREWVLPSFNPLKEEPIYRFKDRDETSINDLFQLFFGNIQERLMFDYPPRPTQLYPAHFSFPSLRIDNSPFKNQDPGFEYLNGISLINLIQNENGNDFVFYFLPQYKSRSLPSYQHALAKGEVANYLNYLEVKNKSFVALPLNPITETYDGEHQTTAGNRIIAKIIMNDLIDKKLIRK